MVIQLLVNGLGMGCIYGLVALGLVFIWKGVRIVNFAQGDFAILAGYLLASFYIEWQIPYVISIFIICIILALVSVIFERLVYRPLKNVSSVTIAVCTVGVSIFLQNIFQIIWGGMFIPIPSIFGSYLIMVGDIVIRPEYPLIIVVTLFVIIFQQYFLYNTVQGKAMRAVEADRDVASLMGIDTAKVVSTTFAYSGVLTALAGIMLAPIFFLSTASGSLIRLKALAVLVMAGFASVPGAVVGGIILGLSEVFGASYISSEYKEAISFGIIIIILLFRPSGLFGSTVKKKV